MSNAIFQKDFLIPELIKRTDYSILSLTQQEKKEMLPDNLRLLTNEIEKENVENTSLRFDKIEALSVSGFNAAIGAELKKYLTDLKSYYSKEYNAANAHKESIIENLIQSTDGQEALLMMKDNYENEGLADMLKNTTERVQIEESGHRLIRRFQPVYMIGAKNSLIRAPFYASQKNVFGVYHDTYWVNILVIWLMSVFLFVALYFDWLKKLINLSEKSSFRRKK